MSLSVISSCQYTIVGQWRSQYSVMLLSSAHHLHLSGCPVVTCEYVGHLMFILHIERCTMAWTLASSLNCLSGVVICSPFMLVCSLKVLTLTAVCILSNCKPLFAAWSAFTLPDIHVWAGIQLIVGLCPNLDVAFLMAVVNVFKSSFLLLSMFTAVKESVCISIWFLFSLAFSSALVPPTPVPRHLNRRYSTCCRLVQNECILVISVSVFLFPPVYTTFVCSLFPWAVSSLCSCVGSSNCLDASRWHSCIPVVHPCLFLLLIVVCNGWFVFPLILLYSLALLSFELYSTGNIWSSCLIILVLVHRGIIRRIHWLWETFNLPMLLGPSFRR